MQPECHCSSSSETTCKSGYGIPYSTLCHLTSVKVLCHIDFEFFAVISKIALIVYKTVKCNKTKIEKVS